MDEIHYKMINSNFKPVYTNFGYGLGTEAKSIITTSDVSSGFISTQSNSAFAYENSDKTYKPHEVWQDLIELSSSDSEGFDETVNSSQCFSDFDDTISLSKYQENDEIFDESDFNPDRALASTPNHDNQNENSADFDMIHKFEIAMDLSQGQQFCEFCDKIGADPVIIRSHTMKDKKNRVLCPALRVRECEICGNDGDEAHMVEDCPLVGN